MVYIEDAFSAPEEQTPIEHKPVKQPRKGFLPFRFAMMRWFLLGSLCAILVYGVILWIAYGQVKAIFGDL